MSLTLAASQILFAATGVLVLIRGTLGYPERHPRLDWLYMLLVPVLLIGAALTSRSMTSGMPLAVVIGVVSLGSQALVGHAAGWLPRFDYARFLARVLELVLWGIGRRRESTMLVATLLVGSALALWRLR